MRTGFRAVRVPKIFSGAGSAKNVERCWRFLRRFLLWECGGCVELCPVPDGQKYLNASLPAGRQHFQMKSRTVFELLLLRPLFLLVWLVLVALNASAFAEPSPSEKPGFKKGRELMNTYCAVCHLLPEPTLLDRATWRDKVLPLVRKRVGIDALDPNGSKGERDTLEDWRTIWEDYILVAAPDKPLPQPPHAPIQIGLKQFTVFDPQYRPQKSYATLVRIDAGARQLYVGNALTRTLDVMDASGRPVSSTRVDTTLTCLAPCRNGWVGTQIGIVVPHDKPCGQLTLYTKTNNQFSDSADIRSEIFRPTDVAVGDLDGDGREDYVVSCFGNQTGQFAWYRNAGEGKFTENLLFDNRPGATRSVLVDANHDGRLDIVVLMAQAREGIYLFTNQGQGEFSPTPLIEQPPTWGYAHFDLVDFNQDGFPDLITSNGDLGDFESLPKGYHGVRIYLNDGKFKFREAFFYPIHGAYKALAADFDQDGDLDIAAISFFPDYEHTPEESFVYLENQGNLQFKAFSFPESKLGRWLVMDVGDLDGDADLDLVLGAANKTPFKVPDALKQRWEKEGPSVLILKNTLHP